MLFPGSGVRVSRASCLAVLRLRVAPPLCQALRHACAWAAESAQYVTLVEAAPASSSTFLSSSSGCPLRNSGGSSSFSGAHAHRKVQVISMPFQQLSHNCREHLTQLEGVLHKRIPHARRCPISRGCGESGRKSAFPAGTPKPKDRKANSNDEESARSSSCVGHGELFVMSRVVARSSFAARADPFNTAVELDHTAGNAAHHSSEGDEEVFTGVNHAFHKHVNPHGATLRGILKGCAEQNALGAAAASGCPYVDITDVFVLAARVTLANEKHHKSTAEDIKEATAGSADTLAATAAAAAHAAAIFPCPECWRHLCHVARARHQHEQPPLRLYVCASSPSTTVHLLSLAHQRMNTVEEPMQVCIVTL